MKRFGMICAVVLFASVALAPMVYAENIVPCDGVNCKACDFVGLGQRLLNWFITIMATVIAVVFAWAGLKMVMSAGNTGAVEEAKGMMTNSIIGFIILLAAWLLVDTALKALIPNSQLGMWNTIQCTPDPVVTSTSQSGTQNGTPSSGNTGSGSGSTGSTVAGQNTVQVRNQNGDLVDVSLPVSQSDATLTSGFNSVQSRYQAEIASACAAHGSAISDCGKVVTAVIQKESNGNPSAQSDHANGIMQLIPANGGQVCNADNRSCIQNQINLGVQKLNGLYNNSAVAGNTGNALAGYNSGESATNGSSVSGRRPALAASSDCPGLLAYQCATNPGGLQETRQYVGTICRSITLAGGSCN